MLIIDNVIFYLERLIVLTDKICLMIRKITVAPIMADIFLICMIIHIFWVFGDILRWVYCLIFIGVFPLFAYPMQKYIPKFRDKGRRGQRILAMIFAVTGYVLGCLCNLIFSSSVGVWVIFLEYLLSGLIVFIFNKLFKLKISGHACGIAGPIALFLYFGLYVQAVIGMLFFVAVYISSLRIKRHTIWQLLGGSAIPIVVIGLLTILFCQ